MQVALTASDGLPLAGGEGQGERITAFPQMGSAAQPRFCQQTTSEQENLLKVSCNRNQVC